MNKQYFVFILFVLISVLGYTQKLKNSSSKGKSLELGSGGVSNRLGNSRLDSLANRDEFKVELSEKTTFENYKIIPLKSDTIYVDTTLTIKKNFKFNYIRKDDFELLPFHNQGQTFSRLGYSFDEVSLYPQSGARAKHYNYNDIGAINYYQMATPYTELMYRKGLEQGQMLAALITLNLTKKQNISFAYKGLRSLGKYRESLASHGNFTFTYSYHSKNEKYHLKTHLVAQDLLNDENGGLTESSVSSFELDDKNFKDRGRLETNFTTASNMLRGNRYYLNHDYDLITKKDSIRTHYKLNLGHIFSYESKHYEYNQTEKNNYFGESFLSKINDKNHLTTIYNQLNVSLKSDKIFGNLTGFIENYQYKYGYKNVVVLDNKIIKQHISDKVFSAGALWNTNYKRVRIQAKAASTILGDINGNYIKAMASYTKDSLFVVRASLLNNSKSPNYNFVLNQSSYLAYNWQHNDFKNELTRTLLFEFESDKLLNASAQITQLDHYTYFTEIVSNKITFQSPQLGLLIPGQNDRVKQYSNTVNYLKIKASRALSYRKFTLDNTVMYQKVANGSEIFRVPELVTRNTIYYSNYIFKHKPMYIQTGITFKYFSKYYANAYNPLLSEFSLQNKVQIGDYPVIDVFINARVRTMRMFLKAEHLNSLIGKKNYYAAPNYPYRDYVLRFGVVWNFFI